MFEKKSLEEFFEKINGAAESKLTLYLIGGGNMSLRNMKVTTKDVDLVLLNRGELDIFKAAIENLFLYYPSASFLEEIFKKMLKTKRFKYENHICMIW